MSKKKIKEIIIGSNNTGKIREIRDLLPKKYKIFTPNDFNLRSPKENGKSFIENSLIKAEYYSKKTGKICIADDSGLEIDYLDKAPGIFSARWGGKNSNFNIAIKKVFKELSKKDKKWREKKIIAKISGGPIIKVIIAIGPINKIVKISEIRSPLTDENNAISNAFLPCPFLVSAGPAKVVAIDAAVPGIPTSIAGMLPP